MGSRPGVKSICTSVLHRRYFFALIELELAHEEIFRNPGRSLSARYYKKKELESGPPGTELNLNLHVGAVIVCQMGLFRRCPSFPECS